MMVILALSCHMQESSLRMKSILLNLQCIVYHECDHVGGAFMGFLGFSLRKQQERQAIYSLAAQIYRIHGNRQYSYTEIENLH